MKKTIFAIIALFSLLLLVGCNAKEVTISFEENGGVAIENLTVLQESTIDEPTVTREGYTFLGWYEDEAFTTLFDFDTVIVRNITLYAKWSINSYSLTFSFGNGSEDVVITNDYNTTFTYPADPEKVGYTFDGWYLDEAGNTEFSATKIPAANQTVYAKWIQNQYTVDFYLNENDTTPIYSEEVGYGDAVANPPAIPVVTGMEGAWSEDISEITGDLNVYAVYTKLVFTITFQDYSQTTYDTVSVEYGDLITPPSTPSRTGYDFIGYYSPELERNIDLTTYTVTTDLTLVDNYQIQTFAVKFFGGEDGSLIGSVQYIDYGSSATAPTSGLEREGYTFTGWDKSFDNITGELNVYAVYTINQYTVTFDANGGSYLDASSSISVTLDYNSNVTVLEVPTKTGFVFVGWYLETTFDTEVYFGTGIPMPVDGFTVYAKWVELVATTYTVSGTYYFEQEGIAADQLSTDGIYTTTSSESYTPFINVLYGTEMSPVRSIEGYSFYKFVYNGVEYYDQSQLLTITQDETVDVYYRRIILTVSFTEYINNANISTVYYVYYNGSLVSVPTPTPVSGMTVEWERQNFDNIKTHLSVAAIQYDNSLQTVIFMSNGTIIYIATNEPDLYGTIDAHAIVLALASSLWDIQQQGYRFLGWYIAGTEIQITEGTIYYDDSYFTSSNITTVEARWVALDTLNEASDIEIVADATQQTITITFDILPTDVNGVDTYPTDFTFILNGVYIQSSDVASNSLMNYITRSGNTFTLTLSQSDPYYGFFQAILMNSEDNYSTLIPGTHTLQIISVGDDYYVMSSDPSDVYQYSVKSVYEGIPESSTIKDYYIIEDFGSGTLRYIFYTNLTYQFTGMTFEIESGSNHITADGSILRTSSIPGEFRFTITDENGTRTYEGLVVEDIRQFNIGSSYQNYLTEINATLDDDLFLADTIEYPYYVGVNNGFYLDILMRNNNGEKISLDDAILTYTFYLNGNTTALTESQVETYVTFDGNVMYFTNAAVGQQFRIVVEPKYEATMMDMNALEYNITVNDGYNAFTNADLKTLYADLNVHLINVHRDITAELYSNQVYPDGSPINFLATATNDYENYGNVYYRIDGNTDDDQITIEGNFMTIDGSNLEYINPDMDGDGTIIYAQAFDIVSTQIGIFYYNVYQTTPINNNVFTMNNLRILGNTTTPSINYGGTEEEIYNQERLMSQNSGGMLGVVIRNGKADLNNLIIGYTVIGVTTNAYGENSSAEVLTVDMEYLKIYDSWANSVYLWGGSGISMDYSDIGSSGGAAIHFEDVHSGSTGYDDPILILGNNNVFNNWISGQEAWFKAYAMSSVALALKSNINNAVTPLGKTIIQTMENPVTGLETEMINLIFISLPKEGAVTYSNPNDSTSVISASEVAFSITDATGTINLERSWNFTEQLFPIDATTSILDPRISGGQYGFALGSLSDTYAFLGMITEIKTLYYQAYGSMMSDTDAGNLAAIAGFYNLTASESLQVAGYMQYGYTLHESIIAVKGDLDYAQPQYIEVIAPLALTGAAGNVTVLIEMFNTED